MKKITVIVLGILINNALNAQKLNDKGFYVNEENILYTGMLTLVKDNVKQELEIKNGLANGASNYYTNSILFEKGSFTNGEKDGKWERLNPNGTISAIAFYSMGKKTGTWLVYDENGKKRFEMNYSNGEKTGTWTSWDENGAVAGTKIYSAN